MKRGVKDPVTDLASDLELFLNSLDLNSPQVDYEVDPDGKGVIINKDNEECLVSLRREGNKVKVISYSKPFGAYNLNIVLAMYSAILKDGIQK